MSNSLTESIAAQRKYLTPMEDSRWEMTVANAVPCEMEHVVPYFGEAIFSQEAGRKLRLKLVTQQRFKPGIDVEFFSQSPIWETASTALSMGNLKTGDGNILIGVPTSASRYVYDMLISSDIDSGKIRVNYYGATQPVALGKTETALLANRRVTVEQYR